MIIYCILLLIVAIPAYGLGSMSSRAIAGRFVFKENVLRYGRGRGNAWLSNFYRVFGVRGFLILLVTELLRDGAAIGIGALLLGTKGHADAGAAFAGFCLVMGRLWPVFYDLKGSYAIICLVMTGLCVSPAVGVVVTIVAISALIFSRRLSVSALLAGFFMIVVSVVALDDEVMWLCVAAGVAVVVRHIGCIYRILMGTEEKISLRQDLSYKFDEKL